MYLMSCTRLDIVYIVNRLSRYTRNPSAGHWKEIVRVLRYLRYTRNYGLYYTRYQAILEFIAFIALDKCGEEANGYSIS